MTKDVIINLRVSSDQKAKLQDRAYAQGKTLTGYILGRCFGVRKRGKSRKERGR